MLKLKCEVENLILEEDEQYIKRNKKKLLS